MRRVGIKFVILLIGVSVTVMLCLRDRVSGSQSFINAHIYPPECVSVQTQPLKCVCGNQKKDKSYCGNNETPTTPGKLIKTRSYVTAGTYICVNQIRWASTN